MRRFILEKNLERFDFYIEKADNKASFILAFSGALMGGMLLELNNILDKSEFSIVIKHLILFTILGLAVSIFFSLIVIIPRIPKMKIDSCMYFKSISDINIEQYESKINSISNDNNLNSELILETKELANICYKKMIHIRISLLALSISMIFITTIICMKLFIA